jgi:hypothetical protein
MKTSLTIGGALLALAAFASTANAGMTGGISTPTSFSHGDTRIPMTSSIGSVRTFSPDGHVSSNGLELRTAGSHWKKPIDSDQGGNDDPTKKAPKDPIEANGGGTIVPPGGWYGSHPHPHYGQGSGGNGGDNSTPPPQRTHR